MSQRRVVFVCEHGAAKSVIAREHFLRLAKERGLDVGAIARGTSPDAEVSPATRRGLTKDGFVLDSSCPQALSVDDIHAAMLVVSFDADVQPFIGEGAPNEKWDGLPPAKDDYASGKVEIIARVRALVERIATERNREPQPPIVIVPAASS